MASSSKAEPEHAKDSKHSANDSEEETEPRFTLEEKGKMKASADDKLPAAADDPSTDTSHPRVAEGRQLRSPLESVEPFLGPPSLPPNTVNLAGCLVDWMQSIDTYLRDSQAKLEKLRVRCQRCNCNDAPLAEQEPPRNRSKHDSQRCVPIYEDTSQEWDKKDEPEAKAGEKLTGEDISATDEEFPGTQKTTQVTARWQAMKNDVIHERVIEDVIRSRPDPSFTAERRRDADLDALAGALRYWEILTERNIQDEGSANAATSWLFDAKTNDSNHSTASPLASVEPTESEQDVPKPSFPRRIQNEVDRDAILKATMDRMETNRPVLTPPSDKFLQRHALELASPPPPPRNRTLPDKSSSDFQSKHHHAPNQTAKTQANGSTRLTKPKTKKSSPKDHKTTKLAQSRGEGASDSELDKDGKKGSPKASFGGKAGQERGRDKTRKGQDPQI